MSESIYQNCQTLTPRLINGFDYDGAIEIEAAWRDGLTPDPLLTVSQWSEKYRVLSARSAAEHGTWKNSRTPYLTEIMDCLSTSSPVERVVFMKASQVGGTEAGNNFLGYAIHMAAAPMLAVSPTVELAKRNSKQRIDPLIEDVPELRKRIAPARSRDSGNTVLSKIFPGGILVMAGANSGVGLRSMPARYLFCDEVSSYPGDVDGEGDPILLAERRTSTYGYRRKIFLVSTPTLKNTCRIEREFLLSDQRYYFVPCPHCGVYQILKISQLRWPEGRPSEAMYHCEACEEPFGEHHKTKMLLAGEWRPTAEGDGLTRGYHLSSLYSPIGWFSWAEIARVCDSAKENTDQMKVFANTILGETYEEEFDAPEWERLYERRESYAMGIVPEGGLFLVSGVDVQKNHIECELVAYGEDKQSWSVDYFVLEGNTAESAVWKKLDGVLAKDYPHALGGTLPIRVMCVDSGYQTQTVYNWVRKHPQAVWGSAGARAPHLRSVVAIKGRDSETSLIHSVSKADAGSKRKGLRVWNVSGPIAKSELYQWLKLPKPTDEALANGDTFESGYCHFPEYGEEYFKQLTAEKYVVRLKKGFPKGVWEKEANQNNESLDCRVYARCAAAIFGLDRFNDLQWKRLGMSLSANIAAKKSNLTFTPTETGVISEPSSKPKKNFPVLQQPETTVADDPYL